MKKILLTFVLLVGIVFGLFAQKLTYQAVVRDNNQQLVVNTDVKAFVTIKFSTGTPATYKDTVNGRTNIHGLLSIEFGDVTLNGRNWEGATIAVKVVNKNDESTVYVNGDARPVSAVPYALSVNGQSIQNYLTEHHYVDKTELDSRHYLTSDSTVITTMQSDISKNADGIDNLIRHTAKAALRDSVAGQIHDSIKTVAANAHTHGNKALLDTYTQTDANLADAVAKKHEHANAEILNNTTATYTNDDSTKLHDIAEGAEVNVQSDWDQTDNSKDDFIKNKPTIPTTVAELSDAGNYVKNADLTNLLNAMNAKIDSLAHIVDSLSNLTPGGGDTPTAFTCGTSKVKDVDNNEYNTVAIGNQCWMKENLRTKTHQYGQVWTKTDVDSAIYGRYYDWQATMQIEQGNSTSYTAGDKHRGICPEGWHVPSDAEWDTLTRYVFSKDEYKCGDDCGTWQAQSAVSCIANALSSPTGWQSPSGCAAGHSSATLNKTGFTAVPAGRCIDGAFSGFGVAYFWSATQGDDGDAWCRNLGSYDSSVGRSRPGKAIGFSARCLRDAGVGGGTTPSAPATMRCEDVMECMGDTLGKLNEKIEDLNTTVTAQGQTIDSLAHIVDSLSNLTPGGGDEPATFTCGTSKVKDVDDNEYNTVKIGDQCWMKENLRTKTSSYGNVYTKPNIDSAIYGRYYDWQAAMQIDVNNNTLYSGSDVKHRGICPEGWHVPSDAEWTQLTTYVKSVSEYVCDGCSGTDGEWYTYCIAKALSQPTGWSNTGTGCNAGNTGDKANLTGFSAVPAGNFLGGSFDDFGGKAYFWSATQDDGSYAWYRYLRSGDSYVRKGNGRKTLGFSVRCVRDN